MDESSPLVSEPPDVCTCVQDQKAVLCPCKRKDSVGHANELDVIRDYRIIVHETAPRSQFLIDSEMMAKILSFCGPDLILRVGLASKWCYTISRRPCLWRNLAEFSNVDLLHALPEHKRVVAKGLLPSVLIQFVSQGSSVNVFQKFMGELNRRSDVELAKTKLQWVLDHDERVSRFVDTILISWTTLFFVITMLMIIAKLQIPSIMSWASVLAPLATACILDFLYLFPLGVHSFLLHCFYAEAFGTLVGFKLFFKGVVSIPWAIFPVLLIVELHDITHWGYSSILICLYCVIIGVNVYVSLWSCLKRHNLYFMRMTSVLAFAQCVLIGLKVDNLLTIHWMLIWIPIWIFLFSFVFWRSFVKANALASCVGFLYLLSQLGLVCLKLDELISFPWIYVFLPLFILAGSMVGYWMLVQCAELRRERW